MGRDIRIVAGVPAIVLAPMDGLTDAPMRAVQGEIGAFTYAVSEFVRVSASTVPKSVFYRQVPELCHGAITPSGLPVQVQILGGHPERMAQSSATACAAGATAIDINFGCPAPTVNTHDGGATLLKHPQRIREIVRAVRDAVPAAIPVSAKLRLGWDTTDAIFENAAMAAEGGADWLTIHGRTRAQGYQPPVLWKNIGKVREMLDIPVVANGNIWSVAEFRQCREETGCEHFMLGRGALADPFLTHQVAAELGIAPEHPTPAIPPLDAGAPLDWRPYLRRLMAHTPIHRDVSPAKRSIFLACRLKQWLKIVNLCGNGAAFEAVKRATSVEELFAQLTRFHAAD